MKFILLLILVFVGCGKESTETFYGVNGKDGINGTNGVDGKNGYSIVSSSTVNPEMCGESGGTEVFLALDMNQNLEFDLEDVVQTQYLSCNGTNGTNGKDGKDGTNGISCSVNKSGNIATITCGESEVSIMDGATGADGQNASGIYITEIINPCGQNFNNDEVLLKLSNNKILALYDGGPQQDRLAILSNGTYITTDDNQNRSCTFNVHNGAVTY